MAVCNSVKIVIKFLVQCKLRFLCAQLIFRQMHSTNLSVSIEAKYWVSWLRIRAVKTAVEFVILSFNRWLFVTPGLDASSSLELLNHLNLVAESGRLVLLTIHQPRLEIFHMFHKILFLCNGQVKKNYIWSSWWIGEYEKSQTRLNDFQTHLNAFAFFVFLFPFRQEGHIFYLLSVI